MGVGLGKVILRGGQGWGCGEKSQQLLRMHLTQVGEKEGEGVLNPKCRCCPKWELAEGQAPSALRSSITQQAPPGPKGVSESENGRCREGVRAGLSRMMATGLLKCAGPQ